VFAAGVLVAQWVGMTRPETSASIDATPAVEAPSIPPSENADAGASTFDFPRRIR
jgi:hypothetical protein